MRTSNIFVTVDIVICKKIGDVHQLLLIRRKNDPFKGSWALPGGFVDEGEDLDAAALRELQEETSIRISNVEQLRAYGKPDRDPRHHTVSVAFFAFVPDDTQAKAADDAEDAHWFNINELPEIAFDHAEIISFAKAKMQL
ncbi:MAG TPA: NUDIX hydrolase [Flavobacterium sp.]|jgi:8-oxo-dGTP diphosphatase